MGSDSQEFLPAQSHMPGHVMVIEDTKASKTLACLSELTAWYAEAVKATAQQVPEWREAQSGRGMAS